MPDDTPPAPARDTERTEQFSDGVFSIAITLLVLSLKVPHDLGAPQLRAALLRQWPTYLSVLVSFISIGIMWLNHHWIFTLIRRATHGVQLLNAVVLLTVAVVPFSTALLSEYLGKDGATVATAIYCGGYLVNALAFSALWRFVISPRRRPRLLVVAASNAEITSVGRTYVLAPLVYAAALVLSLWQPLLAVTLCGLVALFFALAPRHKARVAA